MQRVPVPLAWLVQRAWTGCKTLPKQIRYYHSNTGTNVFMFLSHSNELNQFRSPTNMFRCLLTQQILDGCVTGLPGYASH